MTHLPRNKDVSSAFSPHEPHLSAEKNVSVTPDLFQVPFLERSDNNNQNNLDISSKCLIPDNITNYSSEEEHPVINEENIANQAIQEQDIFYPTTESQSSTSDSSDFEFVPDSVTFSLNADEFDNTNESTIDKVISDQEVTDLQNRQRMRYRSKQMSATDEDAWTGVFDHDFDLFCVEKELSLDYQMDFEHKNLDRWESQGLDGWSYKPSDQPIKVSIDDVDKELKEKFDKEVRIVLKNIDEELSANRHNNSRDAPISAEIYDKHDVSAVQLLRCFLTSSILEKLVQEINRVLVTRRKEVTTKQELESIVVFHLLCSSYAQPACKVSSESGKEFYYDMGIQAKRYYDIWGALCCNATRRGRVIHNEGEWCLASLRGNKLITWLEKETADVNSSLLFVPDATIVSLDDDHLRLSSRTVTTLTNLRSINNPKKALGPVCNAACSALLSFFLAGHHSRPHENLSDTWVRINQLIQNKPTLGSLEPLPNVVFAADRGYNVGETIKLVSEVLNADLIGTHKRSLDFPFVFGEGPIRRRHKGVVVPEKGCRAIFSATKQLKHGRRVEACVYRESFSGRIAATVNNNQEKFGSSLYTLVPREGPAHCQDENGIDLIQTVHEEIEPRRKRQRTENYAASAISADRYKAKVMGQLSRLNQFTVLQSEDPCWFLLRAFTFTSKTSFGFLQAMCKGLHNNIEGMASVIRGVTFLRGAASLPTDIDQAITFISAKWKLPCTALSLVVCGSEDACADDRNIVLSMSDSQISSLRNAEIVRLLAKFSRRPPRQTRKAVLVGLLQDLRNDLSAGTVQIPTEALTQEQRRAVWAKNLLTKMRKVSLQSWVMKPLVATSGMREGTLNEIEVLKAMPKFISNVTTAFQVDLQPGDSGSPLSTGTIRKINEPMKLPYIRCVGLINARNHEMVYDSPDAVALMVTDEGKQLVIAIEVKTMTSVDTVRNAERLRKCYDSFIEITDIGYNSNANNIFKSLIPNTGYRAQCLHHAATVDTPYILYTVAKGTNSSKGEIMFCCLLSFSQRLIRDYLFCLDSVHKFAFDWIGQPASSIPREYDTLIEESYASDIGSFASYYNLSRALRTLVIENQKPAPPAKMLRPKSLVYWNAVKGGVDEYSSRMAILTHTNSSENPITSVVARLICAQAYNAALAFRLFKARSMGMLTCVNRSYNYKHVGYRAERHRVSSICSFTDFVQVLAKEYKTCYLLQSKSNSNIITRGSSPEQPVRLPSVQIIKSRFKRNVIEKFNGDDLVSMRMSCISTHKSVKGPKSYCVLCSWSCKVKVDGIQKTRRGGANQRQWCQKCKQCICKRCWNTWHCSPKLTRATPPPFNE